jgi:uncharacterized membrane protein (Fun14 family)
VQSQTQNPEVGSQILDAIAPYIGQISFGGLAGFATGYAMKKIGKIALFVFGSIFILLQVLAYMGIIEINWLRVQQFAEPALQRPALENTLNGIVGVLTNNLPFAGSFIPGFLLGLKFG